uniref:Solute carrier family 23 member 2 n=1 Tax=Cacopsylla melanoneura TaxID=428564 RepID=A0A8D8WHE7_9HEMI
MGAKSSEHRTSTDKISSNPRTSDCETSMTTAEEGPVDPGPGRPKLYRTLSVAIILGFSLKNVLTICLEMAAISSILCSALCILPEDVNRVRMFSNLILVLAIGNLAQSTFGVRQSVMHSTSYILLCPILFYLNSPSNQCPGVGDLFAMGPEQRRILWTNKVQHLHGSFIIIALVQVVFSLPTLYSWLSRVISPITLVTTAIFIPVAFLDTIVDKCSKNAFLSIGTIVLFSVVAYNVSVYKIKVHDTKIQVWNFLAFLIAVGVAWTVCVLLTWFDVVSAVSSARTDLHSSMSHYIEYINPYPCLFEWGLPRFSLSAIAIIVPATLVTIPYAVENYKTINRKQARRRETLHLTKGLYVDALCTILNVLLGSVTGFQTSSESLRDITETKIWNRRIVQVSSLFLLCLSMWTPFCFHFTQLPEPLLGAILTILCAQQVVSCVCIVSKRVDLLSKRTLYIITMSILVSEVLDRSLPSLSMDSTHTSRLLLVILLSTMLHHITSTTANTSIDSHPHQDFTPIDSLPNHANESINECVTSL